LREYCPRSFGTWAIFPQLRVIRLTIDLDASHYLYTVFMAPHCCGFRCKSLESLDGTDDTDDSMFVDFVGCYAWLL